MEKELKQTKGQSVVLVTGASSGIGKATALRFARQGHLVYGTSRKACVLEGVTMLRMDVRSDADVAEVLRHILEEQGQLDILVANAGTGIAGAVEETTLEEAISQFDTNYFGALRIIRAVLPVMRRQRNGCIIGVSSVAGRLSIPFQAGYSATKAAMEATLSALREEVKPFGIRVTLVEPGDTKTGFTDARTRARHAHPDSPYHDRFKRSLSRMEHDERNGVPPENIARVIVRVASRRNPPVRTPIGLDYTLLLLLGQWLPDRFVNRILGWMYAS